MQMKFESVFVGHEPRAERKEIVITIMARFKNINKISIGKRQCERTLCIVQINFIIPFDGVFVSFSKHILIFRKVVCLLFYDMVIMVSAQGESAQHVNKY